MAVTVASNSAPRNGRGNGTHGMRCPTPLIVTGREVGESIEAAVPRCADYRDIAERINGTVSEGSQPLLNAPCPP